MGEFTPKEVEVMEQSGKRFNMFDYDFKKIKGANNILKRSNMNI